MLIEFLVLKMLIKKISLRRIELLQFPYQENILPLNHKLTFFFFSFKTDFVRFELTTFRVKSTDFQDQRHKPNSAKNPSISHRSLA